MANESPVSVTSLTVPASTCGATVSVDRDLPPQKPAASRMTPATPQAVHIERLVTMISSLSGSQSRPVPGDDVAGAIVGDRSADVAAPVAVGAGRDAEPDHVDADRGAAAHGHRHHASTEPAPEERHGHPGSAGGDQ